MERVCGMFSWRVTGIPESEGTNQTYVEGLVRLLFGAHFVMFTADNVLLRM